MGCDQPTSCDQPVSCDQDMDLDILEKKLFNLQQKSKLHSISELLNKHSTKIINLKLNKNDTFPGHNNDEETKFDDASTQNNRLKNIENAITQLQQHRIDDLKIMYQYLNENTNNLIEQNSIYTKIVQLQQKQINELSQ